MAYEYKYLTPANGGSASLEAVDKELFDLRERKGKFYTSLAEFLLQMRMLNNTAVMGPVAARHCSNFVGTFVNTVLEQVYGNERHDRMTELIVDVEAMTKVVVASLTAASLKEKA